MRGGWEDKLFFLQAAGYLFPVRNNLNQIQSKRKLLKVCQSSAKRVKGACLPNCMTRRSATCLRSVRTTIVEEGRLREALLDVPLNKIVKDLWHTW